MKALITGFEPFGGEPMNPAYEAVKLLPDTIAGAQIIKLEIPTVFSKSSLAIEKAVMEYNPDIILSVGQAGGRSCVTIERVAINLADAGIPDNEGNQPTDLPVQPDGPDAYFATVPVKTMVENVRKHGLPCHLSYSAGTYVCNSVMYNILYMADKKYPGICGGFIHVPFAEGQTASKPNGTPSMSLASIAKSLEYAIEAAIINK